MPVVERQALHGRQRVGSLNLGELAGSVGAPPGGVDLLRGRHEPFGTVEPGTNGVDAIAAQDVEPVDVLARLAGQGDPDSTRS